jgi:hypothetical protein
MDPQIKEHNEKFIKALKGYQHRKSTDAQWGIGTCYKSPSVETVGQMADDEADSILANFPFDNSAR